jgi:hypothetical protein
MLAEIAFVRLRHGLDQALLQGKSSFSASVAKAQQALNPARLQINRKKNLLFAQDIPIKLRPAELYFYLWLLDRQSQNHPAPCCPNDGAPDEGYAQEYLRQLGELDGNNRTLDALNQGMSKTFFEQRKSRINKLLNDHLQHAAAPYLISPVGKRPRTGYRIALGVEQIEYI